MNLIVGGGTPILGVFGNIDWTSEDHSLNVQLNTGGGLTDLGTTTLTTVPYSFHAKTAAIANNVTGLERVDENIGPGLRIIGRDPANYGDIGLDSVDLSYSADPSTTLGATGSYSIATGFASTASGFVSTAIGNEVEASNSYTTAFGNDTHAEGSTSMAIGLRTIASAFGSFAMGRYNVGAGANIAWLATDPVFEIGNGTSDMDRNNAVTVLKNGKVGVGPSVPDQKLDVDGKLKIGDDTEAPTAGTMRFNPTTNTFEGYNGTEWRVLGNKPVVYVDNVDTNGASDTRRNLELDVAMPIIVPEDGTYKLTVSAYARSSRVGTFSGGATLEYDVSVFFRIYVNDIFFKNFDLGNLTRDRTFDSGSYTSEYSFTPGTISYVDYRSFSAGDEIRLSKNMFAVPVVPGATDPAVWYVNVPAFSIEKVD